MGGGLDPEDRDCGEPKAKPRDNNTVEPVFFHALPESFYTELLTAIPLTVLDLAAGGGALAVSAYKRGRHCLRWLDFQRCSQRPADAAHREDNLAKHVRRHRPAV